MTSNTPSTSTKGHVLTAAPVAATEQPSKPHWVWRSSYWLLEEDGVLKVFAVCFAMFVGGGLLWCLYKMLAANWHVLWCPSVLIHCTTGHGWAFASWCITFVSGLYATAHQFCFKDSTLRYFLRCKMGK